MTKTPWRMSGNYESTCLERIFNKTSLTTKQISHDNILRKGKELRDSHIEDLEQKHAKDLERKLNSLNEEWEEKAATEQTYLKKRHEEELARKLYRQKKQFEEQTKKTANESEKQTRKRLFELKTSLEKAHKENMKQQWIFAEREKERALIEAKERLTAEWEKKFQKELKSRIDELMEIEQEKFQVILQTELSKCQAQCDAKHGQILQQREKIHLAHVNDLTSQHNTLLEKYTQGIAHSRQVQKDFREIQEDYRRFIDYTERGRYNSQYMMKLRNHGMVLIAKTHEEIIGEDIDTCKL